jgi:para-nitrobenzyl esterase
MVGATAHQCSMFLLSDPEFGTMSHEGVVARLQVLAGDRAVSIHEAYRAARPDDSPTDLMVAAFTDQRFRVASIDWSEAKIGAGGTVYQYLFTWETPVLAGKLRSCHALEVPFVFGSQDRSAIAKDGPPSLSESMSATWAAFARNGDPDNDRIPHWPTYDTERRATMIFDDTCRVEDDPFAAERRAWR